MRRKVKQKKMRCRKIVPGLTILFILLTGFPAGFQMEYVYAAEPAYETGISEDAQTETEKWIQQFSFDEMQNYLDQPIKLHPKVTAKLKVVVKEEA